MGASHKRTVSAAGFVDPSVQTEVAQQYNYEMLFGRVDPKEILDSGGWWNISKRI